MKQFYLKFTIIWSAIMLCTPVSVSGQINCQALFEKDSPEYHICMLLYGGAAEGKASIQGSKESQALCDSAITLSPAFADPYYTKAIPFLKRGEFQTWKSIIDQAVKYDSILYLGYRGGARFMFLRDYEGTINDIEILKTKCRWDIGTIYNGEYHLEIIRALSYKGLGDINRAAKILENHIGSTQCPGLFDYYHLGVLYFEQDRYIDAEKVLISQNSNNEIADAYYYLALIYKKQKNKTDYLHSIKKSYDLYMKKKYVRGNNSFMDYPDKIYLSQIESLLKESES